MYITLFKHIKTACILLFILSFLTGLIYPAVITFIAQELFPWRANGSILKKNDTVIGSQLIGQAFTQPNYFWGRPSATLPFPYNAEHSSGSNLGPLNPDYLVLLKKRIALLQQVDSKNPNTIPTNLVTASASGLDPDISPEAAFYQVTRIARARHLSEQDIKNLIMRAMHKRFLTIFGEPYVNILEINLALDTLKNHSADLEHP